MAKQPIAFKNFFLYSVVLVTHNKYRRFFLSIKKTFLTKTYKLKINKMPPYKNLHQKSSLCEKSSLSLGSTN